MKITSTGNRVSIKREGVMVLVDGYLAKNNPGLVSYVFNQAKLQTPSWRLLFFGWPQPFKSMPTADEIDTLKLAKRGRFLTPIIEASEIEPKAREFELVCLTGGRIYDWNDWHERLSQSFKRITIFSMDPGIGEHLGAQIENLGGLIQTEAEKLIAERVFADNVESLALRPRDGLIYWLPPEFNCNFTANASVEFTYLKPGNELGFELSTMGAGKATKIQICVNSARPNESQVFTLEIENTVPKQSIPDTLSKQSNDFFRKGVEAYQAGQGYHYCPLCNRSHSFRRALICSEGPAGGRWSKLAGRRVFDELRAERYRDWAVFVAKKDVVQAYPLQGPIGIIDHQILLIESGAVFSVSGPIAPSAETRVARLKEIHEGLFADPMRDLYVLSIGDNQ